MNLKRLVHESKPVATLAILIMVQCLDRVIYKRIPYDHTEFSLYFANIILSILSLVTSGPIALLNVYVTDSSCNEPRKNPHFKFVLMAFVRTLCNLLSAVPTLHIIGYMADVLNKLGLSFILALSFVVLSTSFKHGPELRMLLVVYGSLVNAALELKDRQPPGVRLDGLRLYGLSLDQQAAFALSAFKGTELHVRDPDVWITNPWISIYQLLWGLASIYILNSWSDLVSFVCEMGDLMLASSKQLNCDLGIFAWFMLAAICHVIVDNVFVGVFKNGKRTIDAITWAVGLPLAYAAYLLPTMTSNVDVITFYDIMVGLGLGIAGVLW